MSKFLFCLIIVLSGGCIIGPTISQNSAEPADSGIIVNDSSITFDSVDSQTVAAMPQYLMCHAALFNGENDSIVAPGYAREYAVTPKAITISMWVLESNVGYRKEQTLFHRQGFNDVTRGIKVTFSSGFCGIGKFGAQYETSSSLIQICSFQKFSEEKWHNVITTYNNIDGSSKIIVDGVLQAIKFSPPSDLFYGNKYNPIGIGTSIANGLASFPKMNGEITNIIILDHEATPTEIENLNVNSLDLSRVFLTWQLDERSGLIAYSEGNFVRQGNGNYDVNGRLSRGRWGTGPSWDSCR